MRLEGRTARNAEPVDPVIRTTHNVPAHLRMRAFERDLIRGGHYGQRSSEPRKQAEHMAATDQPHREKKALANQEPSTHGTSETLLARSHMSVLPPFADILGIGPTAEFGPQRTSAK
jgi:hypothetical protein